MYFAYGNWIGHFTSLNLVWPNQASKFEVRKYGEHYCCSSWKYDWEPSLLEYCIGDGSRGQASVLGGTGGHWSLVSFRLAYESCCEIWCISSFSVCSAWITIRFFTATTEKILQTSITVQQVVEGGCGFTKIGRCLNFCAHCAHNHVKCPPNCQHLPVPMNCGKIAVLFGETHFNGRGQESDPWIRPP